MCKLLVDIDALQFSLKFATGLKKKSHHSNYNKHELKI